MRKQLAVFAVLGMFVAGAYGANKKADSVPLDGQSSIVIVFKDGHQQSFSMLDISRIEFQAVAANSTAASAPLMALGKDHFLGKWEVGEGDGSHFLITLKPDGVAEKTLGARHGTWVVVDQEARITWDDGWHDAIRKVGSKHEKFAYEPGKSFSDVPSNVTNARMTSPKPI
jgi:hypothetical protein